MLPDTLLCNGWCWDVCVGSLDREDSPMHMHNMASRDEDMSIACKSAALEQALTEDATPFTEHATAFPPSGLGQVQCVKWQRPSFFRTFLLQPPGWARGKRRGLGAQLPRAT